MIEIRPSKEEQKKQGAQYFDWGFVIKHSAFGAIVSARVEQYSYCHSKIYYSDLKKNSNSIFT